MKLIEVLIALFILALFAALGVPSLRNYVQHTNDRVLQETLLAFIHSAQQEADAREARVTVGLSENRRAIIQFLESDKTHIIAKRHIQKGNLGLQAFPHHSDHLEFLPLSPREDNGTIWYCPAENQLPAWKLIISKTGRTQIVYPDSRGVLRDTLGKILTCA